MKWPGVLLLCLLSPLASAGHGMLNAFAGIPWLPEPGLAPDSAWYPLQRWHERWRLANQPDDTQRFAFASERARLHLATAEAMAAQGKADALSLALAAWNDTLELAIGASKGLPGTARLALFNELLEQQYIASTDYLDLPLATRRPLRDAVHALARRYAGLAADLPRSDRAMLFAREEEVRWSLSMMVAADEQGL